MAFSKDKPGEIRQLSLETALFKEELIVVFRSPDESLSELTNTVKTLRGIVKSPASGKRKTRVFSLKSNIE